MDNNDVDSVLRAVYVGVVVMLVGNGMGGFSDSVCVTSESRRRVVSYCARMRVGHVFLP